MNDKRSIRTATPASKTWTPRTGFPTEEQMARMVAADVRVRVEQSIRQRKEAENERLKRRERLRTLYRRHLGADGEPVAIDEVREIIEGISVQILAGWRRLANVDHIALAESGTREDFDELEFLVSRGLCELNGLKNIVCLARRLA